MLKKRTLISLFTGAGGLDLGLEQAGLITKIANELESHACETLKKNKQLCQFNESEITSFIKEATKQRCFQRTKNNEVETLFSRLYGNKKKESYLQESFILEGDIRNIPSSTFKSHLGDDELFCIAGGPPCQPFSKAGKKLALDCIKNGDLFYEFVRVVNDLKPKWFIFENVKGITFTKTDVIYQKCDQCQFEEIAPFSVRKHFSEENKALPCTNCGSTRSKWLIRNEPGGSLKIILNEFKNAGYTCDFNVLNAANYGAPQIRERLIIVGSLENKKFLWPEETHKKELFSNVGKQADLFCSNENLSTLKPWISMREALWPTGHPNYGYFEENSACLWVKNVVRPHDEPVTWSLNRPAPTIGAHQSAKLAFTPFGVPENQLKRQQWSTKGKKQGDTAPVFVEHTYLSDEELLKLQTFPSWWYLHGTRMQRAFQIGNAVPPILGKALGLALIKSEENS